MLQLTQVSLFSENDPKKEVVAKNNLWHYFFDNFGLMLLDEQINEILKKVTEFQLATNQKEIDY